ncbi:MAG: squalene/phytoene synthase family protein [Myxococcota bacterium]
MNLANNYDVVVVGAGPAGTGAAAGHACRGARVLLLEANPKASHRFAGEWIHHTGRAVLERMGLAPQAATAHHPPCRGFAVFPDDGSEPIQLHYADGTLGFSSEHGELVEELRARAVAMDGITYLERARVTSVGADSVTFKYKGGQETVRAGRIVAADGRSSVVRRSLRAEDQSDVLSHMAGVELHGTLPFEGFGHVLLGGPGPVLLYRIAENRIRACIDIPVGAPGARRDARFLWDAFAPRFPAQLRGALREALESRRVSWACNRFMPRTFYGEGRIALIGDAVGFYHPLTASGITIGLKDAEALVASDTVAEYARTREPQSYVPELLANALNQVFMREDESAEAIRRAVFEMWRGHADERERTMRILAGDEVRVDQFGAAFFRVAIRAVRDVAKDNPRTLRRFVEWSQWPGATLVPDRIRRRIRPASSTNHPLKGLRFAPTPFSFAEAEAPKLTVTVDVDRMLSRIDDEDIRALPAVEARAEALRYAVAERNVDAIMEATERLLSVCIDTTSGARAAASALRDLKDAFPGLLAVEVRRTELAIQTFLRGLQAERGAFGTLRETAEAMEALVATGVPVFHASVRRAFRSLGAAQRPDGSWDGDAATTAVVARALLATRCPLFEAAEHGLSFLNDAVVLDATAGEALRLYRDLRTMRVTPVKARGDATKASNEDHAYCKESLLAVSRSFARPIEMLPGDLRTAVTCGYLLCRIADTVEDNAFFSTEERDERYATFLRALGGDENAIATFERQFVGIRGNEIENDLCRHLSVVLRVFRTLPAGMQTKTVRWVAEMTRGMQIYSHRDAGDDGIVAVHTVEDLERYCFYVAGTVGHMLTDLFVESFGEVGTSVEHGLREQAEAFGIGLQLVNILKDVTDDKERMVSYVPRVSCAKQGLSLDELLEPQRRDTAHAVVAPLFDAAQGRLDRALEYVLQIPKEHQPVRLFCLLPLWMAVRTLVHARGNDAMFTTGAAVKISRAEVEQLIGDCLASAGNDDQLRAHYDALWRAPALTTSSSLQLN